MAPAEGVELLQRLAGGRADNADMACLREPLAPPITAEHLVAAAAVLRGRGLGAGALPNRTVIDLCVAGPLEEGRLDVTVPAALLVAACDGTAAQHSWFPTRSGGEALVGALGLPTQATPRAALKALKECGHAWLTADAFHPAWASAGAGLVATSPLLALLGPLLNPASPKCLLVGVADASLTEPLARALGLCGAENALVVSSAGRPCLSPTEDTVGHRWSDGHLTTFHHPGTGKAADGLESAGATVDAARIEATFDGLRGPLADAIALNAGAALWIAGLLPTLPEAKRWARSRLSQKVDLVDFCGPTPATSPTRTAPASDATSRRSPHPPRGGARRSRDPKG